jgi:two-component system, LytTR family, response regulator
MSADGLRALIVDDEPVARNLLRAMLAEYEDVHIVGECRNAREAVAAIRDLEPDVVFLDIQMPGGDGFSVIERIGIEEMPAVVFVTAYDEFALRAFEVVAADYLLKPFDERRLERTIRRLRERPGREESDAEERLISLLQELRGSVRYLTRVAVDAGSHVSFIPTSRITWLEAKGKHTLVHADTETYTRREGLSELTVQLDPAEFIRVHRSSVVRIDRIKEVHRWSRGGYYLVLTDGTKLTTGGRYKAAIEEALLGKQRP